MTLKIEVTVPETGVDAGHASIYLAKALVAIGYSRFAAQPEAGEVLADEGPNYAAMKAAAEAVRPEPEAPQPPAIRYIGQASGGKRRTKAEIALDEEATRLLAVVGLDEARFNAALDKAAGDWDAVMADLRAAAEARTEAKPAISTGGERVDPAAPPVPEDDEDDGETETCTHDDVRAALGDYAARFGMPAATSNGPKLMGAPKISAIPDDQAALRKAVLAIRAAIEKGEA